MKRPILTRKKGKRDQETVSLGNAFLWNTGYYSVFSLFDQSVEKRVMLLRLSTLLPTLDSFCYDSRMKYSPVIQHFHSLVQLPNTGVVCSDEFDNKLVVFNDGKWLPFPVTTELRYPAGMWVHQACLYICDSWHHRIVITDFRGKVHKIIGQQGHLDNEFDQPRDLIFLDGRFFVCDHGNARISIFDEQFRPLSYWPLRRHPWDNLYTGGAKAFPERIFNVGNRVFIQTHLGMFCYEENEILFYLSPHETARFDWLGFRDGRFLLRDTVTRNIHVLEKHGYRWTISTLALPPLFGLVTNQKQCNTWLTEDQILEEKNSETGSKPVFCAVRYFSVSDQPRRITEVCQLFKNVILDSMKEIQVYPYIQTVEYSVPIPDFLENSVPTKQLTMRGLALFYRLDQLVFDILKSLDVPSTTRKEESLSTVLSCVLSIQALVFEKGMEKIPQVGRRYLSYLLVYLNHFLDQINSIISFPGQDFSDLWDYIPAEYLLNSNRDLLCDYYTALSAFFRILVSYPQTSQNEKKIAFHSYCKAGSIWIHLTGRVYLGGNDYSKFLNLQSILDSLQKLGLIEEKQNTLLFIKNNINKLNDNYVWSYIRYLDSAGDYLEAQKIQDSAELSSLDPGEKARILVRVSMIEAKLAPELKSSGSQEIYYHAVSLFLKAGAGKLTFETLSLLERLDQDPAYLDFCAYVILARMVAGRDEAERILAVWAKKSPQTKPFGVIAEVHFIDRYFSDYKAGMNKLNALEPDSLIGAEQFQYYFFYSRLLLAMGDKTGAISCFEKGLSKEPSWLSLCYFAQICIEEHEYRKAADAMARFSESCEHDINKEMLWLAYQELLSERMHGESLRKGCFFEKVISSAPVLTPFPLWMALYAMERYEEKADLPGLERIRQTLLSETLILNTQLRASVKQQFDREECSVKLLREILVDRLIE
jgi:tetratricopeptide (TPR) repeat protein